MTAWRCSACGQPVELATAREHYDLCAAGDRDPNPDRCVLCDAPADEDGEVCDACAEVAL
jgi:hypothetical protein